MAVLYYWRRTGEPSMTGPKSLLDSVSGSVHKALAEECNVYRSISMLVSQSVARTCCVCFVLIQLLWRYSLLDMHSGRLSSYPKSLSLTNVLHARWCEHRGRRKQLADNISCACASCMHLFPLNSGILRVATHTRIRTPNSLLINHIVVVSHLHLSLLAVRAQEK